MRMNKLLFKSAFCLTLMTGTAIAKVTPEEVQLLGTELTPLGAELAANADGSIPAWTGGLAEDAGQVDGGGFLSDPFAAEKPLFVITAANVEQYKDKLSSGQLAMFKRYPDTYRMPVYPSHRTTSVPEEVYQAAKKSAASTEAIAGGNGLGAFSESRYYAFPIPKSGVEVLWNHVTRYRGGNYRRAIIQATPQANGSFTPVRFVDELAFPADMGDLDTDKAQNLLFVYKQVIDAPARLAGNVLLVHETIDQVKEPRLAWLYNAGQRRVRRAPQVSYDGPGNAADGMRTVDNFDMFNGAPDRYEWKLVGKREMYVPYNSYKLSSTTLKYAEIHQPGHINQELARYELHRVWEVEATLKPGQRHIYSKRTLYFDEDSWMIVLADHYDGRGQLWRSAEGHNLQHYIQGTRLYVAEALYDLVSGRYLTLGLSNEEKQNVQFLDKVSANNFTPAALRSSGIR